MSSNILVERNGGIATITLNRPEKLNAMTKPMWLALGQAFEEVSADPALRCVVLRGAGERSFSPGNDIGEFANERSNTEQGRAYGKIMHHALRAIASCQHPVVAAIQGICVGGGLEIAALCDLRICGEASRFGVPINMLGLVMAHAELSALIEVAGPAVAREILFEGRVFGAKEALEKRLVTRVVADTQVLTEAYATAERIAAGAPLAARWHKRFIRQLLDRKELSAADLDEGFTCYDSADFKIGYQAFLKKEKPKFIGQ